MDFLPLQPYFNEFEAWGDPERVEWHHIHMLYQIRVQLIKLGCDWPIIIHCSYELTGHSDDSYHHRNGRSCASDWHFDTDAPFAEQIKMQKYALLDLRLTEYVGLGIYPEWNSPGFHVDSRGHKSRWVKIGTDYIYDMQVAASQIDGVELGTMEL